MPEQINNEAVKVLQDFTNAMLHTASEVARTLTELTEQALQAADEHQNLVAVERWGDEGGYCP